MSDPLDDLASANEPTHRLNYATRPAPKPDKTIYIALIAGGCLITIVMMWFVFAAPVAVSVPPAPVTASPPTPSRPQLPAASDVGAVEAPAAPKPGLTRAERPSPRPAAVAPKIVWSKENAVELQPSILDDGRLQIVVVNKSPGRIVNLKVDIRTSEKENAIEEVLVPAIEPGKQFSQAYDFPALRRRDDPKALPYMEISGFDFAEQAGKE